MTKEQFDNYRFSIITRVKVNGEWHKLISVNFCDYQIWFEGYGGYIDIKDVEDIAG